MKVALVRYIEWVFQVHLAYERDGAPLNGRVTFLFRY